MPCDKECCVVLITSVGLMMMLLHKEEGILYNDKILERLSASTKETVLASTMRLQLWMTVATRQAIPNHN
jgi:hypothetical protein